jgi:hypothetical protein
MDCSLVAAVEVAENLLQIASLWAIRVAMVLLFLVLAVEIVDQKRTSKPVAILWFTGAVLALCHSMGALVAYHHSSQAEALESTAEQTEELLGIRFGAGLYFNYLFVLVWILDALLRLAIPFKYLRIPSTYFYLVYGFLIFIAVNGAIVFKTGIVRGIGILCLSVLALLWIRKWRRENRRD